MKTTSLRLSSLLLALLPAVCLAGSVPETASARSGGAGAGGPSVQINFSIQRTAEKCLVDGRLSESFWQKTGRLDGFRVDADPARIPAAGTEVRLAYDGDSLLAAFICEVPKPSAGGVTGGEPGAGEEEFCEISVFSRPETPFYSPFLQRLDFMNANESVRTMRRFQVTPANARREANVHKLRAHTPYIVDEGWNCAWESAVASGENAWIVEISIPWKDIGGFPGPGHHFRINLVRSRLLGGGTRETSCFNWYSGENIRVRPFASENFIQEYPTIFASVRFEEGMAGLTRFVETEDPWRVPRPRPEYRRLLTKNNPAPRSTHFYLGLSSFLLPEKITKLYDAKTWEAEEANLLDELGRAGVNGPFLPGFLTKAGLPAVQDLFRRYGMRFSWHGGVSADEAMKAGATVLTPIGTPAFFDPAAARLKQAMLEDFLKKHGESPWLFDVWGQDEPFNQIATILQPGMYDRVNRELKEEYGVELGVPPGIPHLPYERQPVHDNSRGLPDHPTMLSRIATFRWMNKTYADVARGEFSVVRKTAPGMFYQAYNRNAVADMDFLDQALLWDFTDGFSADPYPSFCIYVYGPARSRYHVGFTSKLVTDLAAGKPTLMIIQGCEMIQRLSTAENVREWASQAAKAGVTRLDWWGTPRLDTPGLYKEMIRLARLWKTLPALDIPEKSEIGVLFSDDARAAAGDEALHAHYTLHSLLGENLGAWFQFVSENHIRKGLHNLDGKKLLFAPQLAYVSRPFAAEVTRRVKEGAVLTVFDPDALSHDIETGSLEDIRKELIGMGPCPKKEAGDIHPTAAGRARFKIDGKLPLRPLPIAGERRNARALQVPSGAKVLFTYEDGSPAAFSRKYGRGEVIVFGALPFLDSELAVAPGGWERVLGALIKEAKISTGLPIWRFLFPEPGSSLGDEMKFLEPLAVLPEP